MMRVLITATWRRRAAGMMAVWGVIAITGLMAVVSLGVDLGRVQVAKTELRTVADAAARYAATGIADGTAVAKAQAVASENKVDAQPLNLLASDVDLGNWNAALAPKFSTSRTPTNAVRVNARKLAARGTAVPTYFIRVLGVANCDVSASAIAMAGGTSSHGLIGLQSIDLNGTDVDSYSSAAGAYGGENVGEQASLASNGSIKLNSSTVKKDVYMLSGESLDANSSSYGTRKTGATLTIPTPSAGSYATINNNGLITPAGVVSAGNFNADNKNVTIPAGNYYFNSFDLKGGTLNVTGDATIYVNGDVHVHGNPVFNVGGQPGRLTIKVVAPSGAQVHFNGVGSVFADIQAPTADIHLNSTDAFHGRLVGQTIKLNSTDAVHFDTSLPPLTGATNASPGGGAVSLVQ